MSHAVTTDAALPIRNASSPRLTNEEKMLLEMRFSNERKNTGIAYLLLLLTAVGHNFYLGRIGRGIAQLLLCFVLVGFIWIFLDLFTLAGTVRQMNEDAYNRLTIGALRG